MPSQVSVYTVILLISSISIQYASAQYNEPDICMGKCLCLYSERAVSCNENANIRGLPTNLDKSITRYIVQRATFDNPSIFRHNLTGLEHLTFLKIIYCNLRYIGARTFVRMKGLLYLDLSHNQLINIASLAFSGLSLKELHIMENVNIKFQPNAFIDMAAETINMRSNNLSEISYELFKHTKVKWLYLFNNRITTVDPKFQRLFNDSDSLIDLSNNPLTCDCSLSWLAEVLTSRVAQKKSSLVANKINISCNLPAELYNRQLMFLSTDELNCSPLRIKTVRLHFDSDTPQLTCVSRIGGSKTPTVTWLHHVDDYEKHIINGLTAVEKSSRGTFQSSTSAYSTINLTKNFFDNGRSRLICLAAANDEVEQRLEIHIHRMIHTLITTSSNHTLIIPPTTTETSFLFVKHFSLLEMFAAVLGTFSATFVGLLVLLRYLRSYQEKMVHKTDAVDMHRSVNSIKPYWYVSHGNSSTYSMPNSHPEYENPATLDHIRDLTNMYSSFPGSRTGFLDFKTQSPIVT